GRDELVHMIDAITTNKTDFFRESRHFKFLVDKLLPEYLSRQDEGHRSPICLWSAGCSTGEEAYTLSMVLAGFGERQAGSHFDFTILATDISSQVLEIARRGIYAEERIAPVPEDLRLKYVLRSRDRTRGEVRIAPEIRSRVTFRRLNLMEREPGLRASVDVVFCRNVLIYFTRKTQEEIVNSFFNYLRPGGYLFVGHSETLTGLSTPFRLIQPTVYRAGS
ncbi:MAG: CheR family methyltransferase, partial [Acidobacteriota bacterium]